MRTRFLRTLPFLLIGLTAPTAFAQRGSGGPRDPMQEGLPLKPTRTMTMTTRVGHWMSVDVSRDGQTLVFDLLGDIYTMPIAGGKATPLTRGMGFDAQPRFSPDGKKVVFVSDRDGGYNLYVMTVDKKDTVQLTTGKTNRYYSPTFTPDGKYVIATRGPSICMYLRHRRWNGRRADASGCGPPTGGRARRWGGVRRTRLVRWAPRSGGDPRYVWFAQRRGKLMYNTPLQDYTLAVYDRESGQTTTRESRWGSAFRPVLSPDNKWLVYGTRYVDETRLRIRDLKTGEEKWLVYPVQRDDQESSASLDVLPGMAFTPDSKWVITTWDGKLWKVPVPSGKPVEIPFEAEVVQPMGPAVRFEYSIPDSSSFVIKQIRDATPSPDGASSRSWRSIGYTRWTIRAARRAGSPARASVSSSRRGARMANGLRIRRGTAPTAATCTRFAQTGRASHKSSRRFPRTGSIRRSRRVGRGSSRCEVRRARSIRRWGTVRRAARRMSCGSRRLAATQCSSLRPAEWSSRSSRRATRRASSASAPLADCSRCAGMEPTSGRCFE